MFESEWNRQLIQLTNQFNPDLVYITNGHFCKPETIRTIQKKNVPVMCFYHDVRWKNIPLSRFHQLIREFDLIGTTRKWQAEELYSAGARDVIVTRFGYEPTIHRPVQISERVKERYSTDLVFIGTHETHRKRELEELTKKDFNFGLKIWGAYWDRVSKRIEVEIILAATFRTRTRNSCYLCC